MPKNGKESDKKISTELNYQPKNAKVIQKKHTKVSWGYQLLKS